MKRKIILSVLGIIVVILLVLALIWVIGYNNSEPANITDRETIVEEEKGISVPNKDENYEKESGRISDEDNWGTADEMMPDEKLENDMPSN